MNSITINGQVIEGDLVAGRSLNITSDGDKVIINGQTVLTTKEKNITVVINGDVRGNVETKSGNVNVYGNVLNNIQTMSGDVHIDQGAGGDVKTMSGDVTAGTISGKTSTMSGNIRTR